jgi:hypothetical protein
MSNTTDMSTPVTRGELRAEIEQFEQRLDQKLDQFVTKVELDERLKAFATKVDLEAWGSRLYDVINDTIKSSHKELSEQLGRQMASYAKAFHEDMSRQIARVDDKYVDLPPRVRRLENTVYPPRRR